MLDGRIRFTPLPYGSGCANRRDREGDERQAAGGTPPA
jgi:hypothetical protein